MVTLRFMPRRLLSTLAFVCCISTAPIATAQPASSPITSDASVDNATPTDASSPAPVASSSSGSGSGSGSDATVDPHKSSVDPESTESLMKAAYKAITTKNWFLLAGVGLALIALGVNTALAKKWSVFKNGKVKWVTVGVLAGIGGLVHAWIADVPIPTEQTFMGALKVFVAAVFAYVSAKQIAEPAKSVVA